MKKIVIYFSYTGNTKKIAQMIAKRLNCDILELYPVTPYSNDYDYVVKQEQNNDVSNKMVEIKNIGINLDDYDEIIIGSPVWWYSISPVVRTFLHENNLSDKTIKPFATNAGWLGKTFKEIKLLCPNSNVDDGMNIVFKSYSDILVTSIDDINNWIDTL